LQDRVDKSVRNHWITPNTHEILFSFHLFHMGIDVIW
jgi:hypothetical protein